VQVDLVWRDVQEVAAVVGGEEPNGIEVSVQGGPNLGHPGLQNRPRLWWRIAAPDEIDQPFTRDEAVGLYRENSEYQPLLPSCQVYGSSFDHEFDRSKNPQLHRVISRDKLPKVRSVSA
jgi:hypothetical protein